MKSLFNRSKGKEHEGVVRRSALDRKQVEDRENRIDLREKRQHPRSGSLDRKGTPQTNRGNHNPPNLANAQAVEPIGTASANYIIGHIQAHPKDTARNQTGPISRRSSQPNIDSSAKTYQNQTAAYPEHNSLPSSPQLGIENVDTPGLEQDPREFQTQETENPPTQYQTQGTNRPQSPEPSKGKGLVRSKSVGHRYAVNGQHPRVDSAEPQHDPQRSDPESELRDKEKDELRDKLESVKQKMAHYRKELRSTERHVEELTDAANHYRDELRATKNFVQSLENDNKVLEKRHYDLQAHCSSVKKERDNLKKHISAMNQAYKARGLSYDDIAQMDQLKEQVASMRATEGKLHSELTKAQADTTSLRQDLVNTEGGLQVLRMERERERRDYETQLRDIEHYFESQLDDLSRQHQQKISDMNDKHAQDIDIHRTELKVTKEETTRLSAQQLSVMRAEAETMDKMLVINKVQQEAVLAVVESTSKRQQKEMFKAIEEQFSDVHRGLSAEFHARQREINIAADQKPERPSSPLKQQPQGTTLQSSSPPVPPHTQPSAPPSPPRKLPKGQNAQGPWQRGAGYDH